MVRRPRDGEHERAQLIDGAREPGQLRRNRKPHLGGDILGNRTDVMAQVAQQNWVQRAVEGRDPGLVTSGGIGERTLEMIRWHPSVIDTKRAKKSDYPRREVGTGARMIRWRRAAARVRTSSRVADDNRLYWSPAFELRVPAARIRQVQDAKRRRLGGRALVERLGRHEQDLLLGIPPGFAQRDRRKVDVDDGGISEASAGPDGGKPRPRVLGRNLRRRHRAVVLAARVRFV